ncbi:hypothetical protein JTB14_025733 [Gonioctena quinquepunctata]|nr:hypothetical protein JTB14_025733 [Gonioctena quinquepunctata]
MAEYSAFTEDFRDLDRKSEMFETDAKTEHQLLLQTLFQLEGGYELRVGISPARSLSPTVTIAQYFKPSKISLGPYEWDDLIVLLQGKMDTFQRIQKKARYSGRFQVEYV